MPRPLTQADRVCTSRAPIEMGQHDMFDSIELQM